MDDQRTTDALNELASLYLTGQGPAEPTDADPQTPAEPDTPDADPPAAELVLVGHLPGFASLWIGQYAQRLAENRGATVLLQIDSEGLAVDLFVDADALLELPDPDDLDLAQWFDVLTDVAAAWLVHVPDPDAAALPGLAPALPAWTLLTSANEAALVEAYRLMKHSLARRRRPTPPGVRLMFMGCNPDEADLAAEKIQRTARRFLQLHPLHVGTQHRMEPVRRRRLGWYDLEQLRELQFDLTGWLTALPGPDDQPAAHPRGDDERLTPHARRDHDHPADVPVGAAGPRLQLAEDYGDDDDNDDDAGEPAPPRAKPAAAAAPNRDISPAPLPAYVADLVGLEARCPRQPRVDLAVDSDGRLHLLLLVNDTPPAEAVARLLEARCWALEHLDLLRLTSPEAIDPDPAPQLHLFTDDPRPLGRLAHTGPADQPPLRLHLLKRITVGPQTAWTHVELN